MATEAMEIKVSALKRKSYAGTNRWDLYWTSPETGKRAIKQVRASNRKEALLLAGQLQAELEAKHCGSEQ